MATRTGRLFHDQNLIANGAGNVTGKADFAGQKKGRAGGRKPLGDLSNAGKPVNQVVAKKALDGSLNSGKPSVGQASKQLKSRNLTIVMNDEDVSAKAKNLESIKRTTASKVSEKSQTGSRKALSDISNAGKPRVPEIKTKNSLKTRSLLDESPHPCAIAEERISHNHEECIKSQFQNMDVHHFFKTVGLEDDSDDEMTVSFELPATRKLKSESAYLDLEEMPERLPEVQSPPAKHDSPAHCKTPKLSSCYDFAVNFKLIETPTVSKN